MAHLAHEALNDAMEPSSLEVKGLAGRLGVALLASAETAEIFRYTILIQEV